ncbi:RNA polymerase sigma-70 factor [Parapedobacter sp. SGR-10]|uniref:RNA polymerase sigma-70 factor n=1 Tax=Parapedobacter sp. SGR-10 TaxID=2710879 RepID=UPI0013D64FBD|nr:RNA polymerase sigma-70 factor [Parapedobacter sp. SGR-10]NGF55555.1 RNA polymerase sigma-70 factor [Parapedobacter sp. SGR-10]
MWQSCRKDDKKALAELFDRYFPKVYALTSRNIKDSMAAEELAMDLFFKLWQKREQITITDNVPAYLLRSAKNMVINHLQKQTIVCVPVDALHEESLVAPVQADQGILTTEIEHNYRNALDGLSPQRREVFVLSREENLTYSEIAERMDLSVNTVKNYITAALTDMRKSMSDYTAVTVLLIGLLYAASL